jgi:hypothetical protein
MTKWHFSSDGIAVKRSIDSNTNWADDGSYSSTRRCGQKQVLAARGFCNLSSGLKTLQNWRSKKCEKKIYQVDVSMYTEEVPDASTPWRRLQSMFWLAYATAILVRDPDQIWALFFPKYKTMVLIQQHRFYGWNKFTTNKRLRIGYRRKSCQIPWETERQGDEKVYVCYDRIQNSERRWTESDRPLVFVPPRKSWRPPPDKK